MRMYDIIVKKRNGEALSDEELAFFVKGYTEGTIPDYQVSALLMAILLNGMTDREIFFCQKRKPMMCLRGISCKR